MPDFTPRVLTMAVNKMKPVGTRVLDVVFKRKKRQLTGIFSWDIKSATNQLLESIAVSAEAVVRGGIGRANITCKAPRYSEKELITAADIADMRKFGSAVEPELMKERVGEEQADMKTNMDLTREFQAVKALAGKVVDKKGKVLVDYKFPAEMKPVLSGAALWTDTAGDPIKNIKSWKKLINRNCGGVVTGFHAFCGEDAMNALMDNEKVKEKLDYQAGKQIAESGEITRLAKVNIEEYDGAYTDAAGAVHDMIPANVFALVGLVPDGAAELFAPVVDLDAPGGVGKGKQADIFFSKMWDVKDPSGKWIKVESRPLPALMRLVVVYAEVTA